MSKKEENRRRILKNAGAILLTAGGAGAVGVHSLYEDSQDKEQAREVVEEEVDREVNRVFNESRDDIVDDVSTQVQQREIYLDLGQDIFTDVYEFMRDNLDASDYNHNAGTLHGSILDEDYYDNLTDGDIEDGELDSFSILWGKKPAVDSKVRGYVEWEDEEDYLSQDIEDSAAEAFVDAFYEVVGEETAKEYMGDNW